MMTSNTKPFVLHVDDEPDYLRTWESEINSQGRVHLEVRHPDDVDTDSLKRASLVLVDFKIEHWASRENVGKLALQPANGLALLSVLQEAAYELDKHRPRAFTLFTAVVKDVARGLVPQPHIVARAHSLEWVFDKTRPEPAARAAMVAELAEAVVGLPTPWPGDTPEHASRALGAWLGLKDTSWQEAAWDGILRCRPPLHEFAQHTHGIGVLRWALHRVWPYPTFLLSDAHLAARLRVDLASFRTTLAENAEFAKLLSPAQYSGALGGFVERRWWRAAIESIVFDLASRDPASVEVLHEQLRKVAPALITTGAKLVFPVLDANFSSRDVLGAEDEVIEILPDDWPPFADPAWALRTDVAANADLAAIAVRGSQEEAHGA